MKKTWMMLAVAALGLAGFQEARAQGHDHGDHSKHGSGTGRATDQLKLNNGKKWQTDAQLQRGMSTIRDELQKALGPIHAGTYTPEDYKALSGRIEGQITDVIAHCKLPTDVDTQIHLVLADIFAGTDVMKKDGPRINGAVKVIQALKTYETYFEHPNWKPIEHRAR